MHNLQSVEFVVLVILHFFTDADSLEYMLHHQAQQFATHSETTLTTHTYTRGDA